LRYSYYITLAVNVKDFLLLNLKKLPGKKFGNSVFLIFLRRQTFYRSASGFCFTPLQYQQRQRYLPPCLHPYPHNPGIGSQQGLVELVSLCFVSLKAADFRPVCQRLSCYSFVVLVVVVSLVVSVLVPPFSVVSLSTVVETSTDVVVVGVVVDAAGTTSASDTVAGS
jgi:hypothetical protein